MFAGAGLLILLRRSMRRFAIPPFAKTRRMGHPGICWVRPTYALKRLILGIVCLRAKAV